MNNIKSVIIPAQEQHAGMFIWAVRLDWVCPVCGGPRGELFQTLSYDGSRRLNCSGWVNDCGHIDKYNDVRAEALANGLNDPEGAE
jgi:hypothetical protein